MLKLIAAGNRLMMDDGVAVTIAESLKSKLEAIGFEVILGETDAQFCFHLLNADDFIILLDAASTGEEPGSIHTYKLQEAVSGYGETGAQHDMSIIDLMRLYHKPLNGYLITVEIAEAGFGIGLSHALMKKLDDICRQVKREIQRIVKEVQDARHFS